MRTGPHPPTPSPDNGRGGGQADGDAHIRPSSAKDRRGGGHAGNDARTWLPLSRYRERGSGGEGLLDAYLARLQAERNLSAYTLRNYRTDLTHFFQWWERAEGGDLLAVTRPGFRRYLAALDADGVARGSVARKVSTVHSFYRYLVQEGVLAADPLRELRPP